MRIRSLAAAALVVCLLWGCSDGGGHPAEKLEVPRGYQPVLRVERDGEVASFGPFVGYYFHADDPADLSRLSFVCFNERGFYSSDVPENSLLFTGRAVLAELPGPRSDQPAPSGRITPVFFEDAPSSWLDTRPDDGREGPGVYAHFHSLHDARGARMDGYWLAHKGERSFTYDMGGRVGPQSPLHHQVTPGPDHRFARIIEFDQGPPGR